MKFLRYQIPLKKSLLYKPAHCRKTLKPRIDFITNTAPLYRKNLWSKLLSEPSFAIHFYYGHNEINIAQMDFEAPEFSDYQERLHFIENNWVKKKYLVWQSGLINRSFTSNPGLVVLLGEFVVISNWILAVIYRLRGINVVMYGHGMYGGERGIKRLFRKCYYRLANAHLLYENRARQIMAENGFNKEKLYVFYNSLDYDKQYRLRKTVLGFDKKSVYPFFTNTDLPTLLFIGRLTPQKKLSLLIEAVSGLRKNGLHVNLLIIGSGSEEDVLKEQALESLKVDYHFYGPCYEEEVLGRLISHADLCISPGDIGLTAIHCFSYGTPVATHSNLSEQNPEVEAIEDGVNGFLFDQDNVTDITAKTKYWLLENSKKREVIRSACYRVVDTKYNPENQLNIFKQMLSDLQVESPKNNQ